MKTYSILKVTTGWSTDELVKDVEKMVNKKVNEGYEIVTVSFGLNTWWVPTAFITICK